jgi:Leucine-rich repeat (LRR) protein
MAILAWTSIADSSWAQEATITDPNLSAAILEALQKPAGPLTGQDLLKLTNLNAAGRDIRSVQGLEGAKNLVSLDLRSNVLSNVSFRNGLTKLNTLDLGFNRRITLDLSPGMTNLTSLELPSDGLTKLPRVVGSIGLTHRRGFLILSAA